MIRKLLLLGLAVLLTACGAPKNNVRPATASIARSQDNGKVIVTATNLRRIFPDNRRRKRFVVATMGPYSFVYRECVYYEADILDNGRRNVRSLVHEAQTHCYRYLGMVRKWIDSVSSKSRIYHLSGSYRRILVLAVKLASVNAASKMIHRKRNGEHVRSPKHPDELIEKMKRKRNGERAV
jgi:hypothetical protein